MKDSTYLKKAQTYLSKVKIQDCINLLKEKVQDNDILNQIHQIEIRYNSLRKRITNGIISSTDAQLEENRISNSLLMIISNLANPSVPDPAPPNKSDYKWLIIGLLSVSLLGLGYYVMTDNSKEKITTNTEETTESQPEITTPPADSPSEEVTDEPEKTSKPIAETSPPPPKKSDLRITAFQMEPTSPTQKEKIYMQAIIRNSGNMDAGIFKVKWWSSVNAPKPAYEITINSLDAGKQQILNFQYNGYTSWYGNITSKLEVDSDNTISESNENNNTLTKSYPVKKKTSTNPPSNVSSKPDLKITAFQIKPTTPIKGEKIYMQAIVKNLGNKDAGTFKIKWWASVNAPKPAFEKTINSLGAGKQQIFSFQYKGYPSWYGTITSKLEIDGDNKIVESNENNNILKKSYSVKKKD